jgi:hypothetical protein
MMHCTLSASNATPQALPSAFLRDPDSPPDYSPSLLQAHQFHFNNHLQTKDHLLYTGPFNKRYKTTMPSSTSKNNQGDWALFNMILRYLAQIYPLYLLVTVFEVTVSDFWITCWILLIFGFADRFIRGDLPPISQTAQQHAINAYTSIATCAFITDLLCRACLELVYANVFYLYGLIGSVVVAIYTHELWLGHLTLYLASLAHQIADRCVQCKCAVEFTYGVAKVKLGAWYRYMHHKVSTVAECLMNVAVTVYDYLHNKVITIFGCLTTIVVAGYRITAALVGACYEVYVCPSVSACAWFLTEIVPLVTVASYQYSRNKALIAASSVKDTAVAGFGYMIAPVTGVVSWIRHAYKGRWKFDLGHYKMTVDCKLPTVEYEGTHLASTDTDDPAPIATEPSEENTIYRARDRLCMERSVSQGR